MENREILVANTKTQKNYRINTNATTLGELKSALDEAGIDYYGMTFTEGISRTELLNDATQLPKDVIFKGNPTNNLAILLTNTKKKIASGAMDRKTAYRVIKENNLQDMIKEEFGRNFTQVSTNNLNAFIPEHLIAEKDVNPKIETPDEEKPDYEETDNEDYDEEEEDVCTVYAGRMSEENADTLKNIPVIHIAHHMGYQGWDYKNTSKILNSLYEDLASLVLKNAKAVKNSNPRTTNTLLVGDTYNHRALFGAGRTGHRNHHQRRNQPHLRGNKVPPDFT